MSIQEVIWCIFILAALIANILATENKCLKNGLYEHPTDCTKFYSCAPFGPVLMHCPTGLHFNSEYLVCDWPENAGCKGKISDNAGYHPHQSCPIYPHPNDCSKFYLCSSSGSVLMNCPENLYFNPRLLICDWPYNAECFEKRPVSPSSFSSTAIPKPTIHSSVDNEIYSEDISLSQVLQTTESTLTTTNESELTSTMSTVNDIQYVTTDSSFESTTILVTAKTNSTPLCQSTIWPNPNDCKTFYMCSSTGPTEMLCPENLHFNPILLICDWPYNVPCEEYSNITVETTDYPDHLITTTNVSEILTTEELLEITVTEDFDETTIHEEITTRLAEMTTQIFDTTSADVTDSINSSYLNLNSTKFCKNTIWPHPNNCTKFFKCSSTGTVEMMCPDEMYFNPTLLVCDWQYNVDCKNYVNATSEMDLSTQFDILDNITINPTIGTTDFSDVTTTENILAFITNAENLEQNTVEISTDDENLLLSTSIQSIETTSNSTFIPEENIITTTELLNKLTNLNSTKLCQSNIWPHPNDCSKFFMCGSTGAVEMSCPEDLQFNPVLLVCDWPYNANCEKYLNVRPEVTTTKFTVDFSTESNFMDNLTTITDISTDSLEITTTEFTSTHIESFEISIGTTESSTIIPHLNHSELCKSTIWSHPENCSKFFMCDSSGVIEMLCPEDMYFNPELLICDSQYTVSCEADLHLQSETTTTVPTPDSSLITTTDFTTRGLFHSASTEYIFESSTSAEYSEQTTIEDLPSTASLPLSTNGEATETTTDLSNSLEDSTTQLQITTSPLNNITDFSTLFQHSNCSELCKSTIWPHPYNCTKFFLCGSTGAVEMTCPEKLYFNPVLLVCDWQLNVNCNNIETLPNVSNENEFSPLAENNINDSPKFGLNKS